MVDDHPFPRHCCWLAQQAAEKAIKAALVSEALSFPFRHDLDALRNLLPSGWRLKSVAPDLAALTEWAVEARYPGEWPDSTTEDAREAIQQARTVLDAVRADLVARGFIDEI